MCADPEQSPASPHRGVLGGLHLPIPSAGQLFGTRRKSNAGMAGMSPSKRPGRLTTPTLTDALGALVARPSINQSHGSATHSNPSTNSDSRIAAARSASPGVISSSLHVSPDDGIKHSIGNNHRPQQMPSCGLSERHMVPSFGPERLPSLPESPVRQVCLLPVEGELAEVPAAKHTVVDVSSQAAKEVSIQSASTLTPNTRRPDIQVAAGHCADGHRPVQISPAAVLDARQNPPIKTRI